MSRAAVLVRTRTLPAALGIGSIALFIAAIEALIRVGLINRFIVPLPSEIFWALPRIVVEENVLSRFMLTAGEAFSASILVAQCSTVARVRPRTRPPSRSTV